MKHRTAMQARGRCIVNEIEIEIEIGKPVASADFDDTTELTDLSNNKKK